MPALNLQNDNTIHSTLWSKLLILVIRTLNLHMIGHPVLYEDDDKEDIEDNLFQRLERILWSLAGLYNLMAFVQNTL